MLEDKIEEICNLSPDDQEYVLRKTISEIYKNSLFKTCKYLLGYEQITEFTHGPITDCLEAPTKRKLICVPRGTFKSTIGVIGYSIWRLINNPDLRILIDSEIYTNSKNFLREIKAHLQSERLINLFGQFESESNWTEGEITIKQRKKNLKEASITCSGIGATKVSQHFDLIIHDDMNSDNNSNTLEGRKKVINHYRMNTSILEPDGEIVVIGTRYSEDDLIGWILKTEIDEIKENVHGP